MAAVLRYDVRSVGKLARQIVASAPTWTSINHGHALKSGSIPVESCRFYRGSNRDNRKREKRLLEKLRMQRNVENVFDFPTFMRCNYEKELYCFQKRLQIEFNDVSVLKSALTHSSFLKKTSHENEPYVRSDLSTESCERLALLGYKFTSQTITDFIVRTYPIIERQLFEEMFKFIMSRKTTSWLAENLAIPDLILIEHDLATINSNKAVSLTRDDVVCDAFFAVIGAICTDNSEEAARKFLLDFLWPLLHGSTFLDDVKLNNSEDILEAMLQKIGKGRPIPRILAESGKNTDFPIYAVGIFSDSQLLTQAASYSMEKAKQDAFFKGIFKVLEEEARPSDLQ